MMFSYHKAKHSLLLTIVAIGAIATIGIAISMDNSAGNSTNDLSNTFADGKTFEPFNANDGGGMPTSISDIQNANDGGGMPT